MNNPYDLHYVSQIYREEALREARKRHLVEQAKGNKAPRFWLRGVVSAMSGTLSMLKVISRPGAKGISDDRIL